jgi:hypothetical protein
LKPTSVGIAEKNTFQPTATIQMGIDTSSLSFLMSTLSNLYSDNERAVLRELSTNARDSMIAAGRADHPIEISLPGGLSDHLVIKDTGLGMDLDDLTNTYSLYGASSKRESDAFNGILGLGSKSPFTYTDQYSVAAVKNGIKTLVSISRSETGGGTMEVVLQKDTNEPNGVAITIPVQRNHRFPEIAYDFFQYWEEGTVLVNGQVPPRFQMTKIADNLYVTVSGGGRQADLMVMGNVAYPLKNRIHSAYRVVAFVEMGKLNFTPSREALHYTDLTNKTVAEITKKVKEYIEATAKAEIDGSADFAEARKNILKWANIMGRNATSFSYKGHKYVDRVEIGWQEIPTGSLYPKIHTGMGFYPNTWQTKKSRALRSEVMISDMTEHTKLIVTGKYLEKVAPTTQARAALWCDNNHIAMDRWAEVMFIRDNVTSPWLPDIPRITFDQLLEVKLPKRERQKKPLEVMILDAKRNSVISQDGLDDKRPVVYTGLRPSINLNHVNIFSPDTQLIKLSATNFGKLKTNYPQSVELTEAIKAEAKRYVDSLTPIQIKSLSFDETELALIEAMQTYKSYVKDKSLFDALDAYKTRVSISRKFNSLRTAANRAGVHIVLPTATTESLFDKYPLLTVLSAGHLSSPDVMKDVIEYINSKN